MSYNSPKLASVSATKCYNDVPTTFLPSSSNQVIFDVCISKCKEKAFKESYTMDVTYMYILLLGNNLCDKFPCRSSLWGVGRAFSHFGAYKSRVPYLVASFPGPAQLSIACSMEKQGNPGSSQVKMCETQPVSSAGFQLCHAHVRNCLPDVT